MNFPTLNFWLNPGLVIGFECCVVLALAAAAQRSFPQPRWQRTVWRTALVCLLGLLISEWTGFGRGVVGSWLVSHPQMMPAPAQSMPNAHFEFSSGRVPNFLGRAASPLPSPPVWWPAGLWLAGIAVVLARAAVGQILLVALRLRRAEIRDASLGQRAQRIAQLVGLRGRVRLLRLPQSLSPVAFGWATPALGLPPDFETRFSPAEQEAILAHELAHLAARDPLWFLFADFVTALLWWHPLAWWSRRQLRAASELAADEAAALVPDGPGCLARCLVELARRMTVAWGWAGINGGFRSNLGRRVERLARMPANSKLLRVSRSHRIVLALLPLVMALCLALIFGAMQARAIVPNSVADSWERSPAGMLLAQLESPPPPVAATPRPAGVETVLVVTVPAEGPLYFRSMTVTVDELRQDLAQAAHGNPQVKLAILAEKKAQWDRVKKVFDAAKAANITQITANFGDPPQIEHTPSRLQDAKLLFEMGRPNEAAELLNDILQTDPANQTALFYMDLIKDWRRTNTNAVGQMHSWADLDPNPWSRSNILRRLQRVHLDTFASDNERLTNVLKRLSDASRKSDPDGYGVNLMADATLTAARIKISPALKNVALLEALEAVARGADQPLTYLVNDSFVAFLPSPKSAFQTRTFRVDPAVVRQNLLAIYAKRFPRRAPGGPRSLDEGVRHADEGHDSLGGPTPNAPVYFASVPLTNDTEQLNEMLRAHLQSFGVSGLVQPDNGDPFGANKSVFFNDRSGLIMVRATAADFPIITQAIQALDSAILEITIEAKFVQLSRQEGDALGFQWFLGRAATNFAGSIPPAQFDGMMDSILHHTSEDVLTAPRVTTLSGRRAHVGSDGVTLDVDAAVIGTDGWTIQTTASASVSSGDQQWRVAGSHPLRDGETLVLGQLDTNRAAPKMNLVFVTPRITDAVGNLVHH